ncbi:MAG: RrF2 family transcriptional regulator [Promethearchaeia archaeon]
MRIFSEKIKYGIAAIFELAKNRHKGYIQIKEISKAQNIPQNYLEQLLIILKKSGLISSMRGAQGGYKLEKNPAEIKIIDIIEILEGPLNLFGSNFSSEIFKYFWDDIEKKIKDLFEISIEDLIKKEEILKDALFFQI